MLIAIPVNRGNAAPAAMDDHALFRSVEAALRFAYRTEGLSIVKVSSYLPSLRGSTVRGKRRSDGPWDDHAQAAMIIAMSERILDPKQMRCVQCYYTQPTNDLLEMRKQLDYRLLAELYRGEVRANINQWFVVDVVRAWAGDRRDHGYDWWASHMGMHPKTVQRIINGRPDRGEIGIHPFLNRLLAEAGDVMYGPMVEEGLIDDA